MSDHIFKLATALTTSSKTTRPQLGRKVNQNLRGNMPALYRWNRGAVATPAGNLTLHGANLANPWANRENTALFKQRHDVTDANLAATDYGFTSALTYVAFANYNWLVLLDALDQMVAEIGTSLGVTISDDGGFAKINFTSEADTGDGSEDEFTLAADYDQLEHLNLQIKVNSVVQASTAYTLTNVGGKIVVTFAVAPTNGHAIAYQFYPKPGKEFGLVFTTVATLKASTTVPHGTEEITTRDAMWLVTGAGVTGQIDAQVEVPGR